MKERISKCLLKYGYDNKVLWATICLISLNAFCLTSVHLNVTLVDIIAVKGCSKCDCLSHISLYYFNKTRNLYTSLIVFSGVIFTMASTFYLPGRFHSASPRNPDIPYRFF